MIAYISGGTADTRTNPGEDYGGTTSTVFIAPERTCVVYEHATTRTCWTPDPTEDTFFRVHKDPDYIAKRNRFERWMNYIHRLMIRRMFNVNPAVMFRRCGLSKSGWLARAGKAKIGK